MRRWVVAIFIALLSASLAACSSISSGVVTSKAYEPAYTYTTQTCAGYNSKGFCSVYIPQIHHVSEKYRLNLKETRGSEEETGWVYIDQHTYEETQVGDYYNGG